MICPKLKFLFKSHQVRLIYTLKPEDLKPFQTSVCFLFNSYYCYWKITFKPGKKDSLSGIFSLSCIIHHFPFLILAFSIGGSPSTNASHRNALVRLSASSHRAYSFGFSLLCPWGEKFLAALQSKILLLFLWLYKSA